MTETGSEADVAGPEGTDLVERYAHDGYVVHHGLVPGEMCRFLASYLLMMGETGRLTPDGQVPGSGSIYGDPAFEVLLNGMTGVAEAHVGARLVPSYSFARLYLAGGELVRHRDRPSCEHSISLHLGSSGTSWPLYLRDRHGTVQELHQEPGDGVGYQGMELEHWREPLPEGVHAQVFLHWVAADGPNAAFAFDRRGRLGLPPAPAPGPGDAEPVASDEQP